MAHLRKLLICPWFGDLPEWFDKYRNNVKETLEKDGYTLLVDTDLAGFKDRVRDKLDIDCPIKPGTGKVHDYRASFGVLYEEEAKGYDFWGHTDFDCIYGNIGKWITDEFLNDLDIHSNHTDYLCGPWSLYRNNEYINNLFKKYPRWKDRLTEEKASGWLEFQDGFTGVLDAEHNKGNIRRVYTFWQGDPDRAQDIRYADGSLFEVDKEIMMFHFRRTKQWRW